MYEYKVEINESLLNTVIEYIRYNFKLEVDAYDFILDDYVDSISSKTKGGKVLGAHSAEMRTIYIGLNAHNELLKKSLSFGFYQFFLSVLHEMLHADLYDKGLPYKDTDALFSFNLWQCEKTAYDLRAIILNDFCIDIETDKEINTMSP